MSLSKSFKTSKSAEQNGIEFVYIDRDGNELFKCRLARYGGANKRFDEVQERLMKPHKRNRNLSNALKERIGREVFAEAVVVAGSWETNTPEGYVKGIEVPQDDGTEKIEPATPANIAKVLHALPDLHMLLLQEALEHENYRQEGLEADAANLSQS